MSDSGFLDEFSEEAAELLNSAEDSFLLIEKGNNVEDNYTIVFRCFHNLKGASGMMGLDSLQAHMHMLEDKFEKFKGVEEFPSEAIDFFLEGIDIAKKILNGEEAEFKKNLEIGGKEKSLEGKSFSYKERFYIAYTDIRFEKTKIKMELDPYCVFRKEDLSDLTKKNGWTSFDGVIISPEQRKECLVPLPIIFDHEGKEKLDSSTGMILKESMNIENVFAVFNSIKTFNLSYAGFDRALKLLMYQFSDLEQFLIENKKGPSVEMVRGEISDLLNKKNSLKERD